MPRQKPLLFEVRKSAFKKNGREWFITGYPEGKRLKVFFKTEKAAKTAANERNAEIAATGTQDQLPYSLRITALEGSKELEPFGKTLADAVSFYLAHLKRASASISVSELCDRVLEEFERRLKAEEASTRHFTSMKETVKRFRTKFADVPIKTLEGNEIKGWLAQEPLAIKTRNRHLGYIKNIFGMAKGWKLIVANPFEEVGAFNNPKKEKIEILTPEEMSGFLSALDRDWLPFFAISAFTGLRSDEVGQLDWKEIKLGRSLIDLPPEKSKNGRRKLEEISTNLLTILSPFVRAEGPVKPPHKKLSHARLKASHTAGIISWKQNCIRHSFCSYAVAVKGLDWTALQADHSTKMLRDCYLEVVTKEDAERYWQIVTPNTPPNVIPMIEAREGWCGTIVANSDTPVRNEKENR
jgi:integrase